MNIFQEHNLVLVEREVGEDELATSSATTNGHDEEAATASGSRMLHNVLTRTGRFNI